MTRRLLIRGFLEDNPTALATRTDSQSTDAVEAALGAIMVARSTRYSSERNAKLSEAIRILEAITPSHLSLGALTDVLTHLPPDMPVLTDSFEFIGDECSYRGYYDNLAFRPGREAGSNVDKILTACLRAATDTYEGYKGGSYTYDNDTPLWFAAYGCTGRAIVGYRVLDTTPTRRLMLLTKDID